MYICPVMGQDKKEKSTVKSVVAEIAHDLGIDKKLVRQVLVLTFKELALMLILKGRPVMIRRFIKFVVALRAIQKMKKENKKEKVK